MAVLECSLVLLLELADSQKRIGKHVDDDAEHDYYAC